MKQRVVVYVGNGMVLDVFAELPEELDVLIFDEDVRELGGHPVGRALPVPIERLADEGAYIWPAIEEFEQAEEV